MYSHSGVLPSYAAMTVESSSQPSNSSSLEVETYSGAGLYCIEFGNTCRQSRSHVTVLPLALLQHHCRPSLGTN